MAAPVYLKMSARLHYICSTAGSREKRMGEESTEWAGWREEGWTRTDLLDHLVVEDVIAVKHLDGPDGAGVGVARVLDLGEAALADGLADLVRAHPSLPPPPPPRCRRFGLRHPSLRGGGGRTTRIAGSALACSTGSTRQGAGAAGGGGVGAPVEARGFGPRGRHRREKEE
jgi:hypothetical protein